MLSNEWMNESNQINDWPNWNNICPRLQNIFVWCVWSGRVLWWRRDGASHQNQVRTWLGNPSSSDFLLILFVFVNVFICVFDCVCICILFYSKKLSKNGFVVENALFVTRPPNTKKTGLNSEITKFLYFLQFSLRDTRESHWIRKWK